MERANTRVDFGRTSEPVVENISDLSKRRKSHPARLDGTAARHAVTLALLPHSTQHVLKNTTDTLSSSPVIHR